MPLGGHFYTAANKMMSTNRYLHNSIPHLFGLYKEELKRFNAI